MKNLKVILLVAFSLFIFIQCLDTNEKKDYDKTVEMIISAETATQKCCVPAPISEQEDREAMIVKKKGENKTFTLFMGEIKDFTYEKGYEYKLLVKEKHLAEPPADGPSIEYYLIKILDKTRR